MDRRSKLLERLRKEAAKRGYRKQQGDSAAGSIPDPEVKPNKARVEAALLAGVEKGSSPKEETTDFTSDRVPPIPKEPPTDDGSEETGKQDECPGDK